MLLENLISTDIFLVILVTKVSMGRPLARKVILLLEMTVGWVGGTIWIVLIFRSRPLRIATVLLRRATILRETIVLLSHVGCMGRYYHHGSVAKLGKHSDLFFNLCILVCLK